MGDGQMTMLPGLKELMPAQQGSLDRLCGLYAIINAFELALYPAYRLTELQRGRLFDLGLKFVTAMRRLEPSQRHGMTERQWLKLQDAMIDIFWEISGVRLRIDRLPEPRSKVDMPELISWIGKRLDQGRPVLLILWGTYDHFTVVGGISKRSLLLFDSFGYRRVALSSLAIRKPRSKGRHRISRRPVSSLALA
jgi:hypothetical protein